MRFWDDEPALGEDLSGRTAESQGIGAVSTSERNRRQRKFGTSRISKPCIVAMVSQYTGPSLFFDLFVDMVERHVFLRECLSEYRSAKGESCTVMASYT